jgi:hypothetical protein
MLKKNQAPSMHSEHAKKSCGCGKTSNARTTLPVTRSSCLECVEKHLGAAWVLLAEYRDGYPHRLRAIGHLHEAEDESQEWPELHRAIREARKAFQQNGTMPEFEILAELAGNLAQKNREENA